MSAKIKCIVFCGWKGSGKDTFSDYLVQTYNMTKYAFADTLKDYCAEIYEVKRSYFDEINHKENKITNSDSKAYGKSPRDLCIQVGKEYRDKDPDYWIKLVFERIHEEYKTREQNNNCYFVVSDCRFPNELKSLKQEFNCLTIWIKRWEKPPSNDPSEISLSDKDCDMILDNSGSLEYKTLDNIIQSFLKQ